MTISKKIANPSDSFWQTDLQEGREGEAPAEPFWSVLTAAWLGRSLALPRDDQPFLAAGDHRL